MKIALKTFRGMMLLFAAAITPATAGYEIPEGHWCRELCGRQTGIIGLHLSALFMVLYLVSFPIVRFLRGDVGIPSGWRLLLPISGIPAGLILHRALYAYYDTCFVLIALPEMGLRAVVPPFQSWGSSLLQIAEYFRHDPFARLYYLLAWALAMSICLALFGLRERE